MVLALLLCLTPQSQVSIDYYARLVFRESPVAPLRGAVTLTSEQASRRNHFQFVRDEAGRLIQVSFHCGDRLKPLNDTANYFFHAPVLHIRYEGDTEIRHYEDRHGNRVLFWGKVYESRYSSDRSGRRTRLTFVGKDGEPIENAWGISTYHWDHQGPQTMVETRVNLAGEPQPLRPGFEFGRLRLKYGRDGLLERMQNVDAAGNMVENKSGAAQDRLEYDRRGLVVAWNVLDKNGNPTEGNGPNVARGVISYNAMGDEVGICHYDSDGAPMVNAYGFCASTTQYDRFGNLAMRTFLGADGRPTVHEQAGYQSLRMIWSDTGMVRNRLSLFGSDGQPFNHKQRGYAEVVHRYDGKNQVVAVAFYDRDGSPTHHRSIDAARINYRYDAHGRRLEAAYYDDTGNFADRSEGRPCLQLFIRDSAGFLETTASWTKQELGKQDP